MVTLLHEDWSDAIERRFNARQPLIRRLSLLLLMGRTLSYMAVVK